MQTDAELVGLSFSLTPGEGIIFPVLRIGKAVHRILTIFEPCLTMNQIWIGQNIKYDMLMLKWYGSS